jgi:hypothetical protein
MPTYDVNNDRERFEFEVSQKVIGRTVEGVLVKSEYVELNLSEGSAIRLTVDGPNIMITVPGPTECLTWDTKVVQ